MKVNKINPVLDFRLIEIMVGDSTFPIIILLSSVIKEILHQPDLTNNTIVMQGLVV